ncbi:LEAF RUST 10 DISEASE-RESISTANCE LOCUS RECEPTOR-LIKE PROTEIN KINASE-like 1.2 [Gastrolobium bilobum]|uniref:LEAF RUST 10 DISEASE-RESISTANCE LOCUS RECEPTOR-LIKE PROTEIN KINASE-like 1.2 n=1 Tax=Gastrolobium bilobum TaxID=150636 RepID=UPI002AB2DF87|nr:LEAF RUST 10 DISEASE-RESISTANCE LOCUS RECEPTOR-LIKE PROTEIN KINASE-like 1.2 [Gastrolobium bilobum]
MKQRTLFSSSIIHSYIIIIIILFSILTRITFCSVDPNFEACKPQTCGNGQNISYPFYIKGKQEPFCGYPKFELTCDHNGFPILNTSRTQYIVDEICYDSQSLRVSIPAFSKPNTTECVAPLHNFSQYSRRFSVASMQKEVLLFQGCDSRSILQGMKDIMIMCYGENKTSSVVALYREDPKLSIAYEKCKGGVVSTRVEDDKGGIEDALKRGFVLNWTASSCDECKSSGGRCGFDQDPHIYAFRCYCPDKVQSLICDDALTQPG